MKGVIIHGVLLAVMLVYGYRTWTREDTMEPTTGTVVVWNRAIGEIQSVQYQSPRRSVKIERRGEGPGAYWWGIEARTDKRTKPTPNPAVVSDAGAAAAPAAGADAGVAAAPAAGGDAGVAGDGGAAAAPTPAPAAVEEEIITNVSEFPIGPTGDDLIKSVASMRAVRALKALTEETKKEYGLELGDTSFAVVFKNGTKTFIIGNKVSGGKERYALDPDSNIGYVVSGTFIEPMENVTQLRLSDPKGFDAAELATVDIKAGDKTRTAKRVTKSDEKGAQTKTWADAKTGKADQTMANFIDNVDRLRPSQFDQTLKVADLKLVVELTYKDERGRKLATLSLYKREKVGELPTGESVDPTKPPPTVSEYFVVSEKTRVPGMVAKAGSERIEQDIATLLGP